MSKRTNVESFMAVAADIRASADADRRRRQRGLLAGEHRGGQPTSIAELLAGVTAVATRSDRSAIASSTVATGASVSAVQQLELLERQVYKLLTRSPASWSALRPQFVRLFRRARRDLRALERHTPIGECA